MMFLKQKDDGLTITWLLPFGEKKSGKPYMSVAAISSITATLCVICSISVC